MIMLDRALVGGPRYWSWVGVLAALVAVGGAAWARQLQVGLAVTGLSRDVSWGLYIAQFTFLVGVAASAVVVVAPHSLHEVGAFRRVTILGELLAVAAVTMCLLFIVVDMGQPARMLNVLLYPQPRSLMFWDMVSLGGYLALNVVITLVTLGAERRDVPSPWWIRPVILLSIPWAISIHTVTAFLMSGLAARPFWMTALLAPRFLASAFASGPAILILVILALRRTARFDPGRNAVPRLATILTYTTAITAFFALAEAFTVLYGRIPGHVAHYTFLYAGLDGVSVLAPWAWTSAGLGLAALVVLMVPRWRGVEPWLAAACAMVVLSVWIEKGFCLIVGGFVPSPLGEVTPYVPTLPEVAITLGVWAAGLLMLTVFYKVTLGVRGEVRDVA
jgi:molybdopterin-containing oxidoreductase family membrane subunit